MNEPQLPEVIPGEPAVFKTSEPKPRIVFYDGDRDESWYYKTEFDNYACMHEPQELLFHADWLPLITVDIGTSNSVHSTNPGMERIDDITAVEPGDLAYFVGDDRGYKVIGTDRSINNSCQLLISLPDFLGISLWADDKYFDHAERTKLEMPTEPGAYRDKHGNVWVLTGVGGYYIDHQSGIYIRLDRNYRGLKPDYAPYTRIDVEDVHE